MSCGDKGRNLSDCSTQEMQRLPANSQKLGERHGTDFSPQPSKGTSPDNTMSSDLQLPGEGDNKFLLLSHSVCSNLLRQTQQILAPLQGDQQKSGKSCFLFTKNTAHRFFEASVQSKLPFHLLLYFIHSSEPTSFKEVCIAVSTLLFLANPSNESNLTCYSYSPLH